MQSPPSLEAKDPLVPWEYTFHDSSEIFLYPTKRDAMDSFVGGWTTKFTHSGGIPSSKINCQTCLWLTPIQLEQGFENDDD